MPAIWEQLAELGWLGLAVPDRYGGTGMGFVELCILLEEQGRLPLASPFPATAVVAALTLDRFGDESQADRYLAGIAEGRRVFACPGSPATAPRASDEEDVTASRTGDSDRLDGTLDKYTLRG